MPQPERYAGIGSLLEAYERTRTEKIEAGWESQPRRFALSIYYKSRVSPVPLHEIAAQGGINKSTALRLLTTWSP